MRSCASGSSPSSAGAATSSIAAATTSSSVIAVKPCPTSPVSVSTSARQTESEVSLSSPRTPMRTGTLSGVALTRVIFTAEWSPGRGGPV